MFLFFPSLFPFPLSFSSSFPLSFLSFHLILPFRFPFPFPFSFPFILFYFISGNPQGSHTVRTARELILDNFNNKDKQEDEISEKDSGKKTVKVKSVSGFKSQAEKNGIKTMDIGDNQTITFADKSVRSSKTAETKTVSDKMMMVRSKNGKYKSRKCLDIFVEQSLSNRSSIYHEIWM